ncbi:putative ABC exporter domain-containing protein [Clostridium sediminicola]|uniref:putative ABC exporter domain-containing protein n=1 Tax=Clostridium sediminicola TaxID=3114879 RepID=UPI0031F2028F
MSSLFYIMRKSFKNHLLDLKKKPLALIGYILGAAFFIGMIVISFIMPSNLVSKASPEIFGMIVTGLLVIGTLLLIKAAVKNGGTFFRQSDVNLVFTSPVSQKKVLIYGFIKQLYRTIFFLFIFVFQIPNIKNNFALSNEGILIALFAVFIYLLTTSVLSILIYSLSSNSKMTKYIIEKGINILLAAIVIAYLFYLYKTRDMFAAANVLFNSQLFMYLPFFGWIKALLLSAIGVGNATVWINMVLLIGFYAVVVAILVMVNTDYYEDVLGATENYEEVIKLKKEGKSMYAGMKNKKLRKVNSKFTGTGAKAIFQRHMLEYRKAGFLFIDTSTIVFLVSSIVYSFFLRSVQGIDTILYFSVYMLFIFSFQGKWIYENTKPYIFLIPASSASKVFYATLADNIKHFIDGIALFLVAGIIKGADPITILLCIIVFTTYGSVFIYGDVWARSIFGSVHSKNLEVFFKFLLVIVITIPGLAANILILVFLRDLATAKYLGYLAMIAYNILLSGVLLMVSRSVFEKLEMK